jgi:AcrR family transcriptional regulator
MGGPTPPAPLKTVSRPKPTRTIRAPETRAAQLLEAAEALLVERGIESVSIADITAKAGLAKGTFYRYFESREAILAALRERVARQALEDFAGFRPPESVDAWPAFLDALVDGALDFFGHRALHDLLADEPHEHTSASGEWPVIISIQERLAALLSAGVGAGALAGDPEVAACLVFELLHAAGHLRSPAGRAGEVRGGAPVDEARHARIAAETKRILRAALLK